MMKALSTGVATSAASTILSPVGTGHSTERTELRKQEAKRFSFCAIGDMPYTVSEISLLRQTLKQAQLAGCRFVTHAGDIKSSFESCEENALRERFELLHDSPLPLFFVPGDNEWTDCSRSLWGKVNPEIALRLVRQQVAARPESLGIKKLPLERQTRLGSGDSSKLPENIRWQEEQCAFVGINLSGSFNGHDVEGVDPQLIEQRQQAVFAWLRESLAWAVSMNVHSLVILCHANPNLEGGPKNPDWPAKVRRAYQSFKDVLFEIYVQFGKPVLLIHGDSHKFQFDRPWVRQAPNLQRLEVFGSPFVSRWAKVTVTPPAMNSNGQAGFGVEPQLLPVR